MLKEELEAIIASDNVWSGRSTLALAIGILGEYVVLPFFDKTKTILVPWPRFWNASRKLLGLKGSPIALWVDSAPWKKWIKLSFAFMVLAGIVGEYGFSARIAMNANRLQQLSDQDLRKATEAAGDAITQAGNISDRADRLAGILETERKNAARFQKESDAARLALNKQLRSQGPRYLLLREAAPTLARELAPFAGQRAALLICGLYRNDREALETWGTLANILGPDTVDGVKGSNWKMVRNDPIWYNCSLSMQGVVVFVSSLAPQRTRDAADALGRALLKTLPRWDDVRIPGVVNPAVFKTAIAAGLLDKDDPSRLVTEDPELLVVGIGEHPPQ